MSKIIEIETGFIDNMNNQDYYYLIDQLIVLLNIFIENFMKDAWFGNHQEEGPYSLQTIILGFANAAFQNIEKFIKLFENVYILYKNIHIYNPNIAFKSREKYREIEDNHDIRELSSYKSSTKTSIFQRKQEISILFKLEPLQAKNVRKSRI